MKSHHYSICCLWGAVGCFEIARGLGRCLQQQAVFLVLLILLGTTSALAQQPKDTDEAQFAAAMTKTKWRETPMKFAYPSCFAREELFDDNVPAYYYLYSWRQVVMGYVSLGVWAVDDVDYPGEKYPLLGSINIKKITYVHKGKCIYSGYTTDGRVFYMKCKPETGGMVTHLGVLALVYPKSFQPHVGLLIKQISNW
jgi:hypothetical protein